MVLKTLPFAAIGGVASDIWEIDRQLTVVTLTPSPRDEWETYRLPVPTGLCQEDFTGKLVDIGVGPSKTIGETVIHCIQSADHFNMSLHSRQNWERILSRNYRLLEFLI